MPTSASPSWAEHDRAPAARRLAEVAIARGLEVELIVTGKDYRGDADMPERAVAAVDACDLALLLVAHRRIQVGGHSEPRKRATARGARVGFVTHDETTIDARGLRMVAERTRRLAALLTEAERALVTSPRGTRLELDLTGREGIALTNELERPGAWGALPDFFEAAVAPLEGSASGTAVVDGTSLITGIARPPITLRVRDGVIADLTGGRAADLRAYLEAAGENGTALAELGIGTNHLAASALTGTFVDKSIAGTVHLGIGDNRGIGGVTRAAIHTDVQLMAATVELDGRLVVDGRRLRLD
ncbi:MAG: hypothetical protein ACRDUY_14005 [Nitriliruptorales bacterium]